MRIAVGGIHTECSTYNHLIQRAGDFTVQEGADLLDWAGLKGPGLVPLFHARSVPGGPVAADVYEGFRERFIQRLRADRPWDGVLLLLHGAMHVEGMEDAEGDWTKAVRDCVGPDVPIAASYDLHGNVTQAVIDAIDVFAAYRTAPHIDVTETHQRALAQLRRVMRGERPVLGWVPIPVLWPGERTSTEDAPARALYARLPDDADVDANLMVGYVWADTPRATAAAVVTGWDRAEVQRVTCEVAQRYWDARRDFTFGMPSYPLAECLSHLGGPGPVILADSGDNPTGGGVGDRADVLAALIDRGFTGAVVAGIADAGAVDGAARAGVGSTLPLRIGGSLGSHCAVVQSGAQVLHLLGDPGRREAMVDIAGNRVILSEHRRPYHHIADFARFGIAPANERLIVVKSGYLSPELAPLAHPGLMALTDGAVNQDITALENLHRPRPSYPFQDDVWWTPTCRFSAGST